MGTVVTQAAGFPPLGWLEDSSGNCFMVATVGDLPGQETVERGAAGVVWVREGGPAVWQTTTAANPSHWMQYPGVVVDIHPAQRADGDTQPADEAVKGDQVVVQMYGRVSGTFRTSLDTRNSAARTIHTGNGVVTAGAVGADNTVYATALAPGANSATQDIFLDGLPLGA